MHNPDQENILQLAASSEFMSILITGGSGMVGKALRGILPQATYLSSQDADLRNPAEEFII